MSFWRNQLYGPTDPARDANWENPPARKGFFTDTSICIGCKACEVACKEWNQLPEDGLSMLGSSYDNTGQLGASTWRHVAFVEQTQERVEAARESGRRLVSLGMPTMRPGDNGSQIDDVPAHLPGPQLGFPRGPGMSLDAPAPPAGGSAAQVGPGVDDLEDAKEAALLAQLNGTVPDFRWLMASDVCKHCTHAGCLDVCPTGALFRSEFGTVVVQDEICNGCGYCVAACPFGVIERRQGEKDKVKNVGIAQKCTLCYDRLKADQTPACAQTCPTTSIQFGDLDELRERARARVDTLHEKGFTEARLYGANPDDGVGGTGSIFLLLDEPEVYGLPPEPVVTTADLPDNFRKAGFAALSMIALAALGFVGRHDG